MYKELEDGGAFDDGNISRSNLFLSVHDAILFAQQTAPERQKVYTVAQYSLIALIFYNKHQLSSVRCSSKGEIKISRNTFYINKYAL